MNNMLSKLLNKQKKIAGLDIGSSSIKIMELEGDSLENAKLAHYAIEPIPEHLLQNESGHVENIEALAELVRKCWKKSGITTKYVALALPSSTVINKKNIVPIVSDSKEDEDIMKLELEKEMTKYLPENTTMNEISLDYAISGINEQSPTDYDVVSVAAKKEKIEERIAIVEAAGLIPVILDVEQYAIQNMLRLMKGDDFNHKTYLVLDCSASLLKMMIFRKGEIVNTKDTHIGGFNLTRDLMNNMEISFNEAEKIKIDHMGDETFEIIEKTFLNNYVSEFLSAFQYFVSSTANPEVDEIILTGGVAGLINIEEAFKNAIIEGNETHIKTEPYVARPLHSTAKSESISLNRFAKDEPSLFLVTSLAIRPFLRQY